MNRKNDLADVSADVLIDMISERADDVRREAFRRMHKSDLKQKRAAKILARAQAEADAWIKAAEEQGAEGMKIYRATVAWAIAHPSGSLRDGTPDGSGTVGEHDDRAAVPDDLAVAADAVVTP